MRHSPPFSAVDRIGWGERAVFVLVPAVMVLVAPQEGSEVEGVFVTATEWRILGALAVLVAQAVLLAAVMALVTYGVAALSVFLTREVIRALGSSGSALTRALPLLLAFVTFSYYTAELWQSVGRLDSWAFLWVVVLFVGLSAVFLAVHHDLDLGALATFADHDELSGALAQARGQEGPTPPWELAYPSRCPLDRRQQANLRLVATLSRLVGAAVVGLGIFVVLFLLGVLTVNAELVRSWAGADPDILWSWASSRRTYVICGENLRVSAFLAVFSSFYFAVVSASDSSRRSTIFDTAQELVRQACAVRLTLLTRAHPNP